jgi:hypothetical protein
LEDFSLALPNNLASEKPVELGKLIEVAYLVVILSAFVWAKEFLLPLVLAILISFLLAPVVSRLERWRFPRAVAVLSIVAIVFALIGGICSTLSLGGLDLVNSLPKYSENIRARWAAIQQGPPGPLNLALSSVASHGLNEIGGTGCRAATARRRCSPGCGARGFRWLRCEGIHWCPSAGLRRSVARRMSASECQSTRLLTTGGFSSEIAILDPSEIQPSSPGLSARRPDS